MKKIACLASLLLLPVLAQAETPLQRWHQDLSQGYGELKQASRQLSASLDKYCAASDAQLQAEAQRQWQQAFMAWQAVRFIEFGPIEQDSMGWLMQFWPDKKNLIARKSQRLLNSETPVTAEMLTNEGVAVTGFPALEYLLFEHEVKTGVGSACPLVALIGTQVQTNAHTLAQNWRQLQPHFEAHDEYESTVVKSVIHAVEIVRDQRLAAPMGLKGTARRLHYLADAWRSEHSLAAIRSTLEGIDAYFMPGLRLHLAGGSPHLLQDTQSRLNDVLEKARALPDGMKALLPDDEGYARLQSLFISVDALAIYLNDELAVELGVVKGFNSSDGD